MSFGCSVGVEKEDANTVKRNVRVRVVDANNDGISNNVTVKIYEEGGVYSNLSGIPDLEGAVVFSLTEGKYYAVAEYQTRLYPKIQTIDGEKIGESFNVNLSDKISDVVIKTGQDQFIVKTNPPVQGLKVFAYGYNEKTRATTDMDYSVYTDENGHAIFNLAEGYADFLTMYEDYEYSTFGTSASDYSDILVPNNEFVVLYVGDICRSNSDCDITHVCNFIDGDTTEYGACVCDRKCDGFNCGDDGCGGRCSCENGFVCNGPNPIDPNQSSYSCVEQSECLENCTDAGYECGELCGEPCGAYNGFCPEHHECNDNNKCVCQPYCPDGYCGPDGCGDTCNTNCSSGYVCTDGTCVTEDSCDGSYYCEENGYLCGIFCDHICNSYGFDGNCPMGQECTEGYCRCIDGQCGVDSTIEFVANSCSDDGLLFLSYREDSVNKNIVYLDVQYGNAYTAARMADIRIQPHQEVKLLGVTEGDALGNTHYLYKDPLTSEKWKEEQDRTYRILVIANSYENQEGYLSEGTIATMTFELQDAKKPIMFNIKNIEQVFAPSGANDSLKSDTWCIFYNKVGYLDKNITYSSETMDTNDIDEMTLFNLHKFKRCMDFFDINNDPDEVKDCVVYDDSETSYYLQMYDKNGSNKIEERDVSIATREFWDDEDYKYICKTENIVQEIEICSGKECTEIFEDESKCANEDNDDFLKWEEEFLGTSDSSADNDINSMCESIAGCGYFEKCEDKIEKDYYKGFCMKDEYCSLSPNACETAFRLSTVIENHDEVIMHVFFDYAPEPYPIILDLKVEYDSDDLVLVDSRRLKKLALINKKLYSSHVNENKIRLVVLNPADTTTIEPNRYDPIIELVFQRISERQTTVKFSEDKYDQEHAMAPDPEKANEKLSSEQGLWGDPSTIDTAEDGIVLYYSFENNNTALDYNNSTDPVTIYENLNTESKSGENETDVAKDKAMIATLQRGSEWLSEKVDGVGGSAAYLDGNTNHIELPMVLKQDENGGLTSTNNDYAVSMWYYVDGNENDLDTKTQVLFSSIANSEGTAYGILVKITGSEYQLYWFEGDVGTGPTYEGKIGATGEILKWTHLGMQISKNSGNLSEVSFSIDGEIIKESDSDNAKNFVSVQNVISAGYPFVDSNGVQLIKEGDGEFSVRGAQYVYYAASKNGLYRIHRMEPNGQGDVVLFGDSLHSYKDPDYNPTKDKIIYTSNASGNYEIWIANGDGSSKYRITNGFGNTSRKMFSRRPKWSPTSEAIVFESNVYNSEYGDNRDKGYRLFYIKYDASCTDASYVPDILDYDQIVKQKNIPEHCITTWGGNSTNAHWLKGANVDADTNNIIDKGILLYTSADYRFRNTDIKKLTISPHVRNSSTISVVSNSFVNTNDVETKNSRPYANDVFWYIDDSWEYDEESSEYSASIELVNYVSGFDTDNDVVFTMTKLNSDDETANYIPTSYGEVMIDKNGKAEYKTTSSFENAHFFEYEVCNIENEKLCDTGMVKIFSGDVSVLSERCSAKSWNLEAKKYKFTVKNMPECYKSSALTEDGVFTYEYDPDGIYGSDDKGCNTLYKTVITFDVEANNFGETISYEYPFKARGEYSLEIDLKRMLPGTKDVIKYSLMKDGLDVAGSTVEETGVVVSTLELEYGTIISEDNGTYTYTLTDATDGYKDGMEGFTYKVCLNEEKSKCLISELILFDGTTTSISDAITTKSSDLNLRFNVNTYKLQNENNSVKLSKEGSIVFSPECMEDTNEYTDVIKYKSCHIIEDDDGEEEICNDYELEVNSKCGITKGYLGYKDRNREENINYDEDGDEEDSDVADEDDNRYYYKILNKDKDKLLGQIQFDDDIEEIQIDSDTKAIKIAYPATFTFTKPCSNSFGFEECTIPDSDSAEACSDKTVEIIYSDFSVDVETCGEATVYWKSIFNEYNGSNDSLEIISDTDQATVLGDFKETTTTKGAGFWYKNNCETSSENGFTVEYCPGKLTQLCHEVRIQLNVQDVDWNENVEWEDESGDSTIILENHAVLGSCYGTEVTAEGVPTEEIIKLLRKYSCVKYEEIPYGTASAISFNDIVVDPDNVDNGANGDNDDFAEEQYGDLYKIKVKYSYIQSYESDSELIASTEAKEIYLRIDDSMTFVEVESECATTGCIPEKTSKWLTEDEKICTTCGVDETYIDLKPVYTANGNYVKAVIPHNRKDEDVVVVFKSSKSISEMEDTPTFWSRIYKEELFYSNLEDYTTDPLTDQKVVVESMELVESAAFDPECSAQNTEIILTGISQARPSIVRIDYSEMYENVNTKALAGADEEFKIQFTPASVEGIVWKNADRFLPSKWIGGYKNPTTKAFQYGFRGGIDEIKVYNYLREHEGFKSDSERGDDLLNRDGNGSGFDSLVNVECKDSSDCPDYHICDVNVTPTDPNKNGICRVMTCTPGTDENCEINGTVVGICTLSPESFTDMGEFSYGVCTAECNSAKECYEKECLNGPCMYCNNDTKYNPEITFSCIECRKEDIDTKIVQMTKTVGCPDQNSFECVEGSCLTECYSFENEISRYLCDPGIEYCSQGRCKAIEWDWTDFAPGTFGGLGDMQLRGQIYTTVLDQIHSVEIYAYGMEDYLHPPELIVEGKYSEVFGDDWFNIGKVLVYNKNIHDAEEGGNPYVLYTKYPITDLRLRMVVPYKHNVNKSATGYGGCSTDINARPQGSRHMMKYDVGISYREAQKACNNIANNNISSNETTGDCGGYQQDRNETHMYGGIPVVMVQDVKVDGTSFFTPASDDPNIDAWYCEEEPSTRDKVKWPQEAIGDDDVHSVGLVDDDISSMTLLNCNFYHDSGNNASIEINNIITPLYKKVNNIHDTPDGCTVVQSGASQSNSIPKQCYEYIGGLVSIDPLNAEADAIETLEFTGDKAFGYPNDIWPIYDENDK